jgi:hypothetical protein
MVPPTAHAGPDGVGSGDGHADAGCSAAPPGAAVAPPLGDPDAGDRGGRADPVLPPPPPLLGSAGPPTQRAPGGGGGKHPGAPARGTTPGSMLAVAAKAASAAVANKQTTALSAGVRVNVRRANTTGSTRARGTKTYTHCSRCLDTRECDACQPGHVYLHVRTRRDALCRGGASA